MKTLFTLITLLIAVPLIAQPGTNDSTFNILDRGFSNGEGPNGDVRAVAVQQDAKVIIGGNFTNFNEKLSKYIARIDDGFLDTGFSTTGNGFDNYIQCLAIQADGKILVGGNFTNYDGTKRGRIARLNSDGSLDLSFNPSNGFNALVRSIVIQSDGKILVGGNFTTFNGTSRSRVARLNTNGTLDNTYNPGSGFNGYVYSLTIQENDKVLVGGDFTLFNGASRQRIVRINTDGSLDAGFNPSFGFDNTVYALAYHMGKVIAAGDFASFNGTARNRIAVLDSGGGLVSAFNPQNGFNATVYALMVQSDGKILAGGSFISFDGSQANKIARLDSTGAIDTTFKSGDAFGTAGMSTVFSLKKHTDGRIVAGGNFSGYNGRERNHLVRIFSDGTIDNSLNMFTGFNDLVRAIAVQKDGKIVVVGAFRFFNGTEQSGIARLNEDGSVDTTFKTGKGINWNQFYTGAHALAIQADGKIVVGGDFFNYNGTTVSPLVRLHPDGVLDTTFNSGTGGMAGEIYTIAIQADSKILIGGSFGSYKGIMKRKIARVLPNGDPDSTFDSGSGLSSGFDHSVFAMAVQEDGKILVGGGFSSYNDTFFTNRVVRLNPNGGLDQSFNYQNGFNGGAVNTIAIQNDGKIVLGGSFNQFNSVSRIKIVRLKKDGTLDSSFYPGSIGFSNKEVKKVLVQADNQILVSGYFTGYNLVPHGRIVRLNTDGTVDNTISFGDGFSADVETMALQQDDKILVGGDFTSFNSIGRNRVARLNNNCIKNLIIKNTEACESYVFDGTTYTQNGTYVHPYTNTRGCDSIITLNLTINTPTDTALSAFACDSISLNGQVFTNSGTYLQVLQNAVGCDSLITWNLDIARSTDTALTFTACKSFSLNGQTYTQSGSYTQKLINAAGCDSTLLLNLTITHIDSGVTKSGKTLTADALVSGYQWIDCDNSTSPEIPGETNRSFTATQTGNYAVRLTEGNCTATSVCHELIITSLSDELNTNSLNLYPNPAQNQLNIEGQRPLNDAVISLYTLTGQRVLQTTKINTRHYVMDIRPLIPGIYFIEIAEGDHALWFKVVKE